MKKHCPKCGASDKPFIGNFCATCFLQDHDFVSVPNRMEFFVCPQCGKVLVGMKWEDPGVIPELIKSKVKSQLKDTEIEVERIGESPKGETFKVVVKGNIEGQEVEEEDKVTAIYLKKQCDVCGKLDSTYYEAKIQLRSKDDDKLSQAFKVIRNQAVAHIKKDRKAEIFRYEELKQGIDVYLGSLKVAKQSIKSLSFMKPKVTESNSLVGVNKTTGKDRYTFTYCLRF